MKSEISSLLQQKLYHEYKKNTQTVKDLHIENLI
jgi:hypothetical protein